MFIGKTAMYLYLDDGLIYLIQGESWKSIKSALVWLLEMVLWFYLCNTYTPKLNVSHLLCSA